LHKVPVWLPGEHSSGGGLIGSRCFATFQVLFNSSTPVAHFPMATPATKPAGAPGDFPGGAPARAGGFFTLC